jgi:hypothetical protein
VAPFDRNPAADDVAWRLLCNGFVAFFHRDPVLDSPIEWLTDHDYRICTRPWRVRWTFPATTDGTSMR